MLVTKEFKIDEIDRNEKIIIYGAGPIGEIVLKELRLNNFVDIIFCDENPSKRENRYLGLEVISPKEVFKQYSNNIVLVTPMRELVNTVSQLESMGINNIFNVKEFIEKIDLETNVWDINTSEYLSYCRDTYVRELQYDGEGIVLRYVDLPITQKCTLLCKDCSNLMQYFSNPIDYDIDTILESINKLEECVDSIINLTILGGEPFMYRKLNIVLERLSKSKKIKQVLLFTNGTLLPNKETLSAMKKCNILLQISNYEKYSNKIDELVNLLKNENIMYSVVAHTSWNDFGNLSDRGRTEEECKLLFKKCRGKRTLSYVFGKLFHCVRSSHRFLLGVSESLEYVDLLDINLNVEEKRNLIRKLINDDIFIKSCNFCNGFIESSPTVPVAEQTKKVLGIYE